MAMSGVVYNIFVGLVAHRISGQHILITACTLAVAPAVLMLFADPRYEYFAMEFPAVSLLSSLPMRSVPLCTTCNKIILADIKDFAGPHRPHSNRHTLHYQRPPNHRLLPNLHPRPRRRRLQHLRATRPIHRPRDLRRRSKSRDGRRRQRWTPGRQWRRVGCAGLAGGGAVAGI